eukprot:719020-Amphidinium_carterae.1
MKRKKSTSKLHCTHEFTDRWGPLSGDVRCSWKGVVLCLAGGLTVLMSAELAQLSLPQLVALWALMYVFMSATEQAGDNDKDA